MTGSEIIQAFGGRQRLAALTGASPAAVGMWRRIGIPAKYWPELVDHAAKLGISNINFASLRASKYATRPLPVHATRKQIAA